MIRRPPRSTLFPYTTSSDLRQPRRGRMLSADGGRAWLTGSSAGIARSEEHTSELQSHSDLVCRLLLEKKKKKQYTDPIRTTRYDPDTGAPQRRRTDWQ